MLRSVTELTLKCLQDWFGARNSDTHYCGVLSFFWPLAEWPTLWLAHLYFCGTNKKPIFQNPFVMLLPSETRYHTSSRSATLPAQRSQINESWKHSSWNSRTQLQPIIQLTISASERERLIQVVLPLLLLFLLSASLFNCCGQKHNPPIPAQFACCCLPVCYPYIDHLSLMRCRHCVDAATAPLFSQR